MRRGIATMTLDTGVCPPWLFERMVRLGREIIEVVVQEYGPDEFVYRIADPVWFQSLGTVLAFDWNASGLTTILTAALKEAVRGGEKDLGIFICGGKGKTSKKTPQEILFLAEKGDLSQSFANTLVYNSKMSAKVDSSLVQDGYQLYHHSFFFTKNGLWTVVQQGMNTKNGTARRYHWQDQVETVQKNPHNKSINFVEEPHKAISSQALGKVVLNLVDKKSRKTREISTNLAQQSFQSLAKDIQILRRYSSRLSKTITLKSHSEQLTLLKLEDEDFTTHEVLSSDFFDHPYLEKILARVTSEKPKSYEEFLAMPGVGPKTVRALALVAEVIYGAPPSYEDPARYSFAHGGKDGIPYPVDRTTYDKTIEILKRAVLRAKKISVYEKRRAIQRLEKSRNKGQRLLP